jgi:hypothetical protein
MVYARQSWWLRNMPIEREKGKGQKTTCRRTDLVKLYDVDIFVYEFNLKKRGTLRSKTTNIMKRLFPQERNARLESVEPSHRSKRILTSKMLGMNVDSDGSFIDNREEHGSYTSSLNHSFKDNVDSGGISESICQSE